MIDRFRQLASYNRWANAVIFTAAIGMTDEAYRRPTGVYFGSLHATLNHILLTDRLWLKRLTGSGEHPSRLDAILYEDRADLTRARLAEDARLISVIEGYDDAALARPLRYHTTAGKPQEQVLADVLSHLFNHQTHHRGQAHACCSIVTGAEPPPLDLLLFQRGLPAPDVAALI